MNKYKLLKSIDIARHKLIYDQNLSDYRFDRIRDLIKEDNILFIKLFPRFPLQLEELADWMPDPDANYVYMRIIKNGNPNKIEDRRCFIEKTPRVFDPTIGLLPTDWRSWISGPKGSAPEYGLYEPSRKWADDYAKWIGYKF